MEARFQVVKEATGTWAVFDALRGLPATVEGRCLIEMRKEDAEAAIARAVIDLTIVPVSSDRRR